MNRSNVVSMMHRARDTARSYGQKASVIGQKAAVAGTALLMSGAAFAQEATFDTATITTKIATYVGYAVVILLAFAAAVWSLRAAGLVGKR